MLTPADLRADRARQRISVYVLAAAVGVHPGRLGMMLNETIPMPQEIAERLSVVLQEQAPTGVGR